MLLARNTSTSPRQRLSSARTLVLCLMGLTCCVCGSENAFGQEPFPPLSGQLAWEDAMLGNWSLRKDLAERGITFLGYTALHGFGTAAGGIKRDFDPTNRAVLQAHFDLEKLFHWKGAEFLVSGAQVNGDNIGVDVGTPYDPTQVWEPNGIRVWEFYYGQFFVDKQVHLKIGRINTTVLDFNLSPFQTGLASTGYDSSTAALFFNYKGVGTEPMGQWGTRLAIEPNGRDDYLRLGFYNAFPAVFVGPDALNASNGLDLRFRPDIGALFIGEYGYRLNQDPEDSGLPGTYKIGFLYDTSPFDRFDVPGKTKRGLYGMYFSGYQMVYREEGAGQGSSQNDQGLTLWGSFGLHPDQEIAAFPYWLGWGMTYQGLFPGRDDDALYFGNYYSFNSKYNPGDLQTQFEVSYLFQIRPWFQIGPDLQYFIDPDGTGTIDNALVPGFQSLINF
jgi:porin